MKVSCACEHLRVLRQVHQDLLRSPKPIESLSSAVSTSIPPVPEVQTVIFYNGIIRTMQNGDATNTVSALAMDEGRIVAVGPLSECRSALPGAAEVDLDGKCMLPAFIEPHVHIIPASLVDSWIDVTPFDGQQLRQTYTLESCFKTMRENLENYTINGWALSFGLDPSMLQTHDPKEWPNPTKDMLDKHVSDSVCLFILNSSGHIGYANTLAFEKAGFQSDNGILLEMEEVMPVLRAGLAAHTEGMPPDEILSKTVKSIVKKLQESASRGTALMWDATIGATLLFLEPYLFNLIAKSGASPTRLGGAILVEDEDHLEEWKSKGITATKFRSEWFNVPCAKIVSDGSNQGLTGFQTDDYPNPDPQINDEHPHGVWNCGNVRKFIKFVSEVTSEGWSAMIHANGDKALHRVLRALTAATRDNRRSDERHRIEHCSLATAEQLKVMSKAGISPSFLIGHVGYWGSAFKTKVRPGDERLQWLNQTRSALAAGLRITLHTDHMVSPLGPLRLIEQAVTRIMEADPFKAVLNPDEKLTVAEALRTVTYDAAWQCHMEDSMGELAVGKCADIVILAEDPMSRDPEGLRNVKVCETWVGGRKSYSSS